MQLAVGVYLGSTSGAALSVGSGASSLLSGETQGLALDFTDDFWQPTTGFYGSARIIDTGTPANNYDISPTQAASSLLTYTSPSLKMTMGPSGTLRFGAHNLCLQSENFATTWTNVGSVEAVSGETPPTGYTTAYTITDSNDAASGDVYVTQTITTVSGQTYSADVVLKAGSRSWAVVVTTNPTTSTYVNLGTGAFGTTGHTGATIGSLGNGWHRVRCPFTSNNTSTTFRVYVAEADLDFTLTRNGTHSIHATGAHFRRTPSDSTYLATGASARYSLPYEWDSAGNLLGILVEEARTNLCLYSDDLTNAAWSKANATAAKTATGPDGVANSATTITATGANGSARQAITSASAARITSLYVKRRTGTGGVFLSQGDVTGSDLITVADDRNFSSDTGFWTKSGTTAIAAGVATISGNVNQGISRAGLLTLGKAYRVSFTIVRVGAGGVYVASGAATGAVKTTTGAYSFDFVAVNADVSVRSGVTTSDVDIDDITIKEIAETTLTVTAGWTRVNTNAATIVDPTVILRLATSGDAVDVALVQHEVGAFVTSPCPTLGAFVSRNVDNISGTDLVSFLSGSRTGYVHAYILSRGSNHTSFSINSSASGEQSRSEVYHPTATDATALMRDAAGGTINSSGLVIPTLANGRAIKVAHVYATNDMIHCVDGVLGTADPTGTIGTTANKIWIGMDYGAARGRQYIKQILLLPRRMSNADMQSLTAA